MRVSKIMLAMLLMFVLIFGGSMSAFSVEFPKPSITVSADPVEGGDVQGAVTGTFPHYSGWINADEHDDYYFVKWMKKTITGYEFFSNDAYVDDITISWPHYWFREFKAIFAEKPDLIINLHTSDFGSYSGSTPGKYYPGDPIAITPLPIEGYRVSKWVMNESEYTGHDPIDFVMPDADVTIDIYFEEIPWFDITVEAVEPEYGVVDGAGSYQIGDIVTLTAESNRGYRFTHWEWMWDCDLIKSAEVESLPFNPESSEISFPMLACDGHFKAFFEPVDQYGVILVPHPEEAGNPELDENALPADEPFDGMYYEGEMFHVMPKPIPHWHFVGYTWEKYYDEEPELNASTTAINGDEEIEYDTTDPDYHFTMKPWNKLITVHYEEDPYVWATLEYHNTNGGEVKPDSLPIKVYYGDYSFTPAVIPGWQHIYATPNATGEIGEGAEDFTVTFVYQVPPTPTVITETVVVTETVTVTVPATTETVTEEEIPLAPISTPVDLDSIYDQTPPPPTTTAEDIDQEEVPLADALPQTGQLPAANFYGIGGLISAIGIYLKKRAHK